MNLDLLVLEENRYDRPDSLSLPSVKAVNEAIDTDYKPSLVNIAIMPLNRVDGEQEPYSYKDRHLWKYRIIDGKKRIAALTGTNWGMSIK